MSLWEKTDAELSKPKFLSTTQKTSVFFVDTTEASSSANKAKGINTPGWVMVKTHTDSQGQERNKVEVLVALSAAAADAGDSADDVVVGDANLSITTQPSNQTVVAPAAASFNVVASDGGSFQWQVRLAAGGSYTNVADAGVYSGSTTDTLAISNSTGLTGNKYRVIVLDTAGNTSVTSKPATLTVTE